jgi:hypothetical protein
LRSVQDFLYRENQLVEFVPFGGEVFSATAVSV